MSGAFGWGGGDRRKATDFNTPDPGFSKAHSAYNRPAPLPSAAQPSGQASRGLGSNFWADSQAAPAPMAVGPAIVVDPKNRKIVCTAENVIFVLLDGTGSMGTWRSEIWARVRLLFEEAKALLGDNLQIVFGTFGDVKCGDQVEIADPGAGPALDAHLAALNIDFSGGGDEEESPELLAFYLLEQVDVTACKHVYTYFITDEKAAPTVNATYAQQHLGVQPRERLTTKDAFRRLLLKMETYVVLRRTDQSNYDPDRIRAFWTDILPERILPLDDGRRVVDVMLACVAKTTGQMQSFQQSFMVRNQGSQYAAVNFQTVQKSVAMVGGSQMAAPSQHKPSRLLGSLASKPDDDSTP